MARQKKINISCIQGKSQGSPDDNLAYYIKHIQESKKRFLNTQIIFLPELMFTDYFCITENPQNFDLAIYKDASEIRELKKLAKELQIVICVPFFEKVSSAIYFNSMLVIEQDGSINSHYRKMHIPDDPGFYEKYYFRPGDNGYVVAKTSIGNIGLLICWDQWFPEAARLTAMQDADIIFYPTAIGWDDNEPAEIKPQQVRAWTNIMQSHAISNGVYVCAVNRVGKEGHLDFWGHSFVADPFGEIVYQSQVEEQTFNLDLDLNKIEAARKIWPFFRDRRTDSYGELQKSWS